jgi:hypothetical protein
VIRSGSTAPVSAFDGFRFPREVIAVAVRWYLRYGLSYRDDGELLAERDVTVDHVTVCPCRATGGRSDETYGKISGRWTYLYRAVDQYGLWGAKARRRLLNGLDRIIERYSASPDASCVRRRGFRTPSWN